MTTIGQLPLITPPGSFYCSRGGCYLLGVIPECGAARRVRESVFDVIVLLQNGRSPTKTFGDDYQLPQHNKTSYFCPVQKYPQMTTKDLSLKEASIRLFLSNRHKKPPRRIKDSSGHIFSKIAGPIYGAVVKHLQYPVRVQSGGFRHLPQVGFSTHGFDGLASPLKENSQKQLS